jgi:hypothetical protein
MRNLIITFSFLTTCLVLLTLFVGVTKVQPSQAFPVLHPHVYDDTKKPIDTIALTVFYFIPKDALIKKQDNWKEITEKHLKELLHFHQVQFENTSKITYTFFPEIIIGEKTEKEYESLFAYDDHDSLIPVKKEIIDRVLTPTGNLYQQAYAPKQNSTTHQVYLVVFEGDGAAGNDDFSLISRSYLSDENYKEDGTTFLAHEFYHTLGMPDNYQTSAYVYKDMEQTMISLVSNKDIMGQVNISLPYTYIDAETLKRMGL